jgi:hypothetical protein
MAGPISIAAAMQPADKILSVFIGFLHQMQKANDSFIETFPAFSHASVRLQTEFPPLIGERDYAPPG